MSPIREKYQRGSFGPVEKEIEITLPLKVNISRQIVWIIQLISCFETTKISK